MKLPTFLIIGVQKAGTTSVYGYLKEHPQVYMSPIKETNFFATDWENNTEKKPDTGTRKRINSWERYCELFMNVKDEIAIGEASPNYLVNYETSSEMIQRYVPNVKMIAILRNPVDRAYSDYLMHLRDGINVGKVRSLSEQVKFRADSSSTIKKGLYYSPIKHYLDTFDREKLKIILHDDLTKDSLTVMQEIYRFIGVDDTFNPDTSKRSQSAAVPKNQTLNNLLQTKNPVRKAISSTLKVLMPLEMRQKLRSNIIKLNSAGKELKPLSSEERQVLTEFYREDILKLQDLIDRDLSSWLE
ncbi:MAG: sulfotransferase domain-containing protein [Okeania sp. SIO2C9]|uniref:sulfotransferase family protein n=1 Tax=Okeania sp. SIO2C9 TaxID=2607791 RepID=UPI0013C280DC|nr:sulfotransferase domain-containing protein [Okeania sp. SIO2C9]NEQ76710.1 sulfotransferase domain-containing protein [Okeania sp. SIO2C9]